MHYSSFFLKFFKFICQENYLNHLVVLCHFLTELFDALMWPQHKLFKVIEILFSYSIGYPAK